MSSAKQTLPYHPLQEPFRRIFRPPFENLWIRPEGRNFRHLLLVCSGVWTIFFMVGQFLGAPTVFIPQIRKANPGVLSDEMASWLYSVFFFASLPWLFVLPALMRTYGPRVPYGLACLDVLLAYTMFYLSVTPLQILISDIVLGICHASCLTIGIFIVSEYSSPQYRGIFLNIKSASLFWGIWSANAIGTFLYWKCIAYSGFICCIYTLTFVFWPESPQWLASKGRFDECRKSYRWLHGDDEESEKHLEELIASQIKEKNSRVNNDWGSFGDAFRTLTCKQFYGPLILSTILICQYNFIGKFVCAMYSIEILKKMTTSESEAYMGMLILDGVTVFTMYFGCFLSKILNRRTLYFTSSTIGITFLFITSLYLYLVKLSLLEENSVISIALLTFFSIAMGCGPMILNTSIYAEMIPIRFKCVMALITGFSFYVSLAISLKIAPYIFKGLGLHGTFVFYGTTSAVCTALLYKYLPETKDKTLQEIEEYFKDSEEVDSKNSELHVALNDRSDKEANEK